MYFSNICSDFNIKSKNDRQNYYRWLNSLVKLNVLNKEVIGTSIDDSRNKDIAYSLNMENREEYIKLIEALETYIFPPELAYTPDPIELKEKVIAMGKWVLDSWQDKLWCHKFGDDYVEAYISSADALLLILEPYLTCDFRIFDELVEDNLESIGQKIFSLIEVTEKCVKNNVGLPSGGDILEPEWIARKGITDSTVEVSQVFYYTLKGIELLKEKGIEITAMPSIKKLTKAMEYTIKWIIEQQNTDDGGWGIFKGKESRTLPTSIICGFFYKLLNEKQRNIQKISKTTGVEKSFKLGLNWLLSPESMKDEGWGFTRKEQSELGITASVISSIYPCLEYLKKEDSVKFKETHSRMVKILDEVLKMEYWEPTLEKVFFTRTPEATTDISYPTVEIILEALFEVLSDKIFKDNLIKQRIDKELNGLLNTLEKNNNYFYRTEVIKQKAIPSPSFTHFCAKSFLAYISLYLNNICIDQCHKLAEGKICKTKCLLD